jgi:hypothetical protein
MWNTDQSPPVACWSPDEGQYMQPNVNHTNDGKQYSCAPGEEPESWDENAVNGATAGQGDPNATANANAEAEDAKAKACWLAQGALPGCDDVDPTNPYAEHRVSVGDEMAE